MSKVGSALSAVKHHGFKAHDMGHGIAGYVAGGGVSFGAGWGLGELYHRYGETSKLAKNSPWLAMVVGKLGAIGLQAATGGASFGSHVLDGIGNAGLAVKGMEYGLIHARKATGMQVVKISGTATPPAGALPVTSIGALGQAAPGTSLTWDQINELAAMH